MKNYLALFFLSLCLVAATRAMASPAEDYFYQLDYPQQMLALEKLKTKDCVEFLQKFDTVTSDKPAYVIKAFALDRGICMPQDLAKAAEAYELLFKKSPQPISSQVRLALIYAFGPPEVLNSEKAAFYYKQAAIDSAGKIKTSDLAARKALLQTFFKENTAMPDDLVKQLEWVDGVLKQKIDERKKLAIDLEKQGYHSTEFLWN